MKKTSFIILTMVASLSLSVASAQSNSSSTTYSPDYIFESDTKRDTLRYDSLKRTRRDSMPVDPNYYQYYNLQPQFYYTYYYRSRFFDHLYRAWFPRRYYRAINRPGFVPRHIRSEQQVSHSNHMATFVSPKRGGFGRSGRSSSN